MLAVEHAGLHSEGGMKQSLCGSDIPDLSCSVLNTHPYRQSQKVGPRSETCMARRRPFLCQKREFVKSWRDEFPWVEYRDGEGKMFCTLCLSFPSLADQHNTFFIGSTTFRKHNLKAHENSVRHKLCAAEKL